MLLLPLHAGQEGPGKTAPEKAALQGEASKKKPRSAGVEWKNLTNSLLEEYFLRHPDQAFQRNWAGAKRLSLSAYGTEAAIRWRDALRDARNRLDRFESGGLPILAGAQRRALGAWIESELLLLDSQALERTDPSGYVQRAARVLQAAAEATWLKPGDRAERIAAILEDFPAYWADARESLVAPSPEWTALALRDLEDLRDLLEKLAEVGRHQASKPELSQSRASIEQATRSIEAFRDWLLEVLRHSGNAPPRMDSDDWIRLVQAACGTEWTVNEIKARCLRDIEQLDPLARRTASSPFLSALAPDQITNNVWTASWRALELSRRAGLNKFMLEPKNFEVALEESPRTRQELVWLRAGVVGSIRAFIELPSSTWSSAMTTTRNASLGLQSQIALGVRHGFAGEAMFASIARVNPRPIAALLLNRSVFEGIGLYALDWMLEIDWIENPLREDPSIDQEFELMRGYEAARLLASLELHSEGVSLPEAAESFSRRTGVDSETAQAEVLSAQRDPLEGIGYLGFIELNRLEEGLAGALPPQRALALTLFLTTRNPDLRPSDLREGIRRGRRR